MKMKLEADFSIYNDVPKECEYKSCDCIEIGLGWEGDEEIIIKLKLKDAKELRDKLNQVLEEIE